MNSHKLSVISVVMTSAMLPGYALGGNDCCFLSQGVGQPMGCVNAANLAACNTAGGLLWAPDFDCVTNGNKSCVLKVTPFTSQVCTDDGVDGIDCTVPLGACCLANDTCQDNRTQSGCETDGGNWHGEGSDCATYAPNGECIPTMSEWGLAVMTLLTLCAATIVVMRRRQVA